MRIKSSLLLPIKQTRPISGALSVLRKSIRQASLDTRTTELCKGEREVIEAMQLVGEGGGLFVMPFWD